MSDSMPCPLSREQVADAYFLEHRAKLIDIAAFLDRIDRAPSESSVDDFRITAFKSCITKLLDGEGDRAKRILDALSDHTSEPIDSAPMKGAMGAPPPA